MLLITLLLICLLAVAISQEQPPNIVLIIADDLGYNDVSWHNTRVSTPNLQNLAE